MLPEVTERDMLENIKEINKNLDAMKKYQRKGLYKACNLRLFNQHLLHAKITAQSMMTDLERSLPQQPPLEGLG